MKRIKPIDVKPLSDHRLLIIFESGERRIFDVRPYIAGDWFGRLADEQVFGQVRISGRTVEWPDGQDIAPHELYEMSVPVTDAPAM